jgi:hypothetical protein
VRKEERLALVIFFFKKYGVEILILERDGKINSFLLDFPNERGRREAGLVERGGRATRGCIFFKNTESRF